MRLRGYQQTLVNEVNRRLATDRRIVCVAPTGAGKTVMASSWCHAAVSQGKRVLILADRRIIVSQGFRTIAESGIPIGQIMAGEDYHYDRPIQIASIATLKSRHTKNHDGTRNDKLLPRADLLIADEAHKSAHADILDRYPNALVIGLTATPVDASGAALWGKGKSFDSLVETVTNSQLIREDWLLPMKVLAPSEPNIQGVTITSSGEYNQGQLATSVQKCTVFGNVFKEWKPYQDRKTIVFAPTVPYCRGLRDQFEERLGPGKAFVIEAKTPQKERVAIFKAMEAEGQVLVSVDVLREGFDLPIASCGIDLQTNNQLRTYWQKVGRVKRPYPGQKDAVWLDFAGNWWRHTDPNDDPPWLDLRDGSTTEELRQQSLDDQDEPKQVRCPECSHVFNEIMTPGIKCPQCGWVYDPKSPKRVMRMGNGILCPTTEMGGKKKKAEKTAAEQAEGRWVGSLFIGWHANMTVAQCCKMHSKKHGEEVAGNFFMSDRCRTQSGRRVNTIYRTKRELYSAYNMYKESKKC